VDFQQQQLVTSPEQEREEAIAEEVSLLRDNNIIPPKHVRRRESQASSKSGSGLVRKISIPGFSIPHQKTEDEESGPAPKSTEPTETTALLPDSDSDDSPSSENPAAIDKTFEDAVISGNIKTTWQREFKTLSTYSGPLMLTFILQNSLTLTSVFTVGHIGKNELGAVSLGSMTANITGYAVYHGLATSLDTLCAQAYGSGRKKLVGLNLQRAVFFLWAVTIPIATLWWFAAPLLQLIVPEQDIAELAGLYLRILILGAPGYACFESSKRFVQAQGKFAANMYVLFIAAPLNVLMHWLFVWVRILARSP
jgi:MATE family multidrug resistance protein